MTSSQTIYLAAVVVYVFFFLLFGRFFIWKHYADNRYWNRRPPLSLEVLREHARRKGRDLPFFSLIVPARNEAVVIARTIDHLVSLDYDPDRYEIIVATDEKELAARDVHRRTVLATTASLLGVGPAVACNGLLAPRRRDAAAIGRPSRLPESAEIVLALLARFAVTDYIAGRREYRRLTLHITQEMGEPELAGPVARHIVAVETLAQRLASDPRPLRLGELRRAARLAALWADQRENDLVASVYLALAVPVVVAYGLVTESRGWLEPAEVVTRTGQAREEVTARILTVMSGIIARSLAARLESERAAGRLRKMLLDAYTLRFPTTQDVVEERRATLEAQAMAAGAAATGSGAAAAPGAPGAAASSVAPGSPVRRIPVVKHVSVPRDFDGEYPGVRTGREIPSTKGRALNRALSFTDPRSTVYGFYDAESRPDRRVLLYVAWRRLSDDPSAAILQGPVFQVRNFHRMNPLCKVASLYQAIAHDWYLPALFRRLPFVGGTNLYVDRALLERAGGFDPRSLTEDLELGVRAYLKCGAWPEFLPYPSIEQTPPTVGGFFRQRLRWGVGHLQVMDKVKRSAGYDRSQARGILRTLWLKGQLEWVLYQSATLVPPAIMLLYATGHVDPTILPRAARMGLNLFTLIYPCFTFYAYFRYAQYIDLFDRRLTAGRQVSVFLQLLLLPLAAFFFPVPYTAALILKGLGREPRVWVKTPRTAE